jgi:hypothetical protein
MMFKLVRILAFYVAVLGGLSIAVQESGLRNKEVLFPKVGCSAIAIEDPVNTVAVQYDTDKPKRSSKQIGTTVQSYKL